VNADPRLLLRALLRQHFNAFVEKTFATLAPGQDFDPGWHLQAIVHQLGRRDDWRRKHLFGDAYVGLRPSGPRTAGKPSGSAARK
jgi:hypothetical protein